MICPKKLYAEVIFGEIYSEIMIPLDLSKVINKLDDIFVGI
jgi:hypothetical protein